MTRMTVENMKQLDNNIYKLADITEKLISIAWDMDLSADKSQDWDDVIQPLNNAYDYLIDATAELEEAIGIIEDYIPF